MTPETTISFLINGYWMIGMTIAFLFGLFAVVWKGKKEISSTIREELGIWKDEELIPLKDNIKKIEETLSNHDRGIYGIECKIGLKEFGTANSPYALNANGKKLLEDSGFYNIYPKIKDRIFASMEQLGTRTLYDTEKNALLSLKSLENDPVLDIMKEFAINNPDIPLEMILTVAAWVVRDEYWESKHPKNISHK